MMLLCFSQPELELIVARGHKDVMVSCFCGRVRPFKEAF